MKIYSVTNLSFPIAKSLQLLLEYCKTDMRSFSVLNIYPERTANINPHSKQINSYD